MVRTPNLGAQLGLSAENGRFEVCDLVGSLAPSTGFSVYLRMFDQLFQRVILGGRGQATRQMKGLASLIMNSTSKNMFGTRNRSQSGSKQASSRLYITISRRLSIRKARCIGGFFRPPSAAPSFPPPLKFHPLEIWKFVIHSNCSKTSKRIIFLPFERYYNV